ncbi:MAG TPA: DUF1559 domain-containing protein [Planctomycetaceae bacterium]|nr:DUF1559 domain-containing protein [Planctomycetaceae bacterium]
MPPAVASVLDEQAVAVISVDTMRFDLGAAIQQVTAIPVLTERQRSELAEHRKDLAQWLDHFHRAGGRDIWIVLTLADDLTNMPFVVVPLHDGADRRGLEGLFVADKLAGPKGMRYPFTVSAALERNGGLIFGPDQALKRLGEFKGPTRAIPKEALEAVGGAEIQAFLLPTDDQRRVLSEFLRDPQFERAIVDQAPRGTIAPELLRNPGEVPRLALADGLQWLAAGVTTRDTLAVKLVIGSKDAASAQALALWIGGAWQLVKQNVATDKTDESRSIAALIDQLARLFAPKVDANRLTIQVDAKQLIASATGAFLGQAALGVVKRSEATVVKNHLKQAALAIHNYHDVYKQFPPAAIRDAQGRPLLSWRVALLPFLEESKLYKEFHLDEPWDSDHNKPLIAKMPDIFAPRSARVREQGRTTLLVPVGKQTIFGPKEGVPIRDITDGTSNTILIVDVDEPQSVVWTKPDDLNVDGVDVKQALFGTRKDGFACALADGSARFIGPNFSSEILQALLTRNGGEAVAWPDNP